MTNEGVFLFAISSLVQVQDTNIPPSPERGENMLLHLSIANNTKIVSLSSFIQGDKGDV